MLTHARKIYGKTTRYINFNFHPHVNFIKRDIKTNSYLYCYIMPFLYVCAYMCYAKKRSSTLYGSLNPIPLDGGVGGVFTYTYTLHKSLYYKIRHIPICATRIFRLNCIHAHIVLCPRVLSRVVLTFFQQCLMYRACIVRLQTKDDFFFVFT